MALLNRRSTLASPRYKFSNKAQLLTGASTVFDFAKHARPSARYAPYQNIDIRNSDTSNEITVYLNQDDNDIVSVAPGVIVGLPRGRNGAVYSVRVTNAGTGTIAASKIVIEVSNDDPKTDDVVGGIAKMLSNGGAV